MKKNFIIFHFQNQVKADEQKFQKVKKYVIFFLIFARQEIEKFPFFVKKNAIFSHFQNQVKADEQQFQNLKKYLIFFQIFTRQGIENLIIFVKKNRKFVKHFHQQHFAKRETSQSLFQDQKLLQESFLSSTTCQRRPRDF